MTRLHAPARPSALGATVSTRKARGASCKMGTNLSHPANLLLGSVVPISYNPFDKPLNQILYSDLEGLRESKVAEGFFVEYKSQMPSSRDLAKAMGSFANTHGGLLIIGVEDEPNTNVPVEFPGIDLSVSKNPKEFVRNVALTGLHPTPMFASYVVLRPGDSKRAILIVEIPESFQTPHITSDGRIYRRTGEGSDPHKVELNPTILDALYQKKAARKEALLEFCRIDQNAVEVQRKWPYLELYAVLPTFGEPQYSEILENPAKLSDVIRSRPLPIVFGDKKSQWNIGLNIDSIRTTSEGVVAQTWQRHNGQFQVAYTPKTVTFLTDGSMKARIPLLTTRPPHILPEESGWDFFAGHFNVDDSAISYLSGRDTLLSILAHLHVYTQVLENCGPKVEKFSIRARFSGMFCKCMYFDGAWYRDVVKTLGPPVMYEEAVATPPSGYLPVSPDTGGWFIPFTLAALRLSEAVGLPWTARGGAIKAITDYVFELSKAEQR